MKKNKNLSLNKCLNSFIQKQSINHTWKKNSIKKVARIIHLKGVFPKN